MRKKQKQGFMVHEDEENTPSAESLAETESNSDSPEDALLRKENLIRMRKVVDKLKPHYRTLVELRYFKEYSYEEIAQQLDLPIGTVKAQLYRAREFLHSLLKSN